VSDGVAVVIRENRRRLGWTMAELAARSGLSAHVIENIEAGRRDKSGHRRRNITIDELDVIGHALGLEVQFGQTTDSVNAVKLREQAEEWHRMSQDPDIAATQDIIRLATEMRDRAIERWRERNSEGETA
jgi:transcriptional regulator with XRE-family HTH domain